MTFVLAVAAGLVIGVVVGALGGGGAILAVPVLVYLLGEDPRQATTSSLVVVGSSALVGMVGHLRAGRVRVADGLVFGVLGVAGAWLGSLAATGIDPALLMAAFAALLAVVAGTMVGRALRGRGDGAVEPRPVLQRHPLRVHWPRLAGLVVAATVVGLLTGFFGVGGGFMIVPALVLVLGFGMKPAVGTSLLVIVVNSAAALAARLGTGVELDVPLVAVFTAAAVVGSILGGRVTNAVEPRTLNIAFAALLVAVAAYTTWQSIPSLFG